MNEGRRALILDAMARMPVSDKQTFSQAVMNLAKTVPGLLAGRVRENGRAHFIFSGGEEVYLTQKELMGSAPEDKPELAPPEPTIEVEAEEMGECDGCGKVVLHDQGAADPDAKPPEGKVFLGMHYAVRGTRKALLCENCFANGLVWAAKGALGKVDAEDDHTGDNDDGDDPDG